MRERGIVQRIRYAGEVPALTEAQLYEPAVRTGLRAAAAARRLQSGSVRTYAVYLLGLVVGLLVLADLGALG